MSPHWGQQDWDVGGHQPLDARFDVDPRHGTHKNGVVNRGMEQTWFITGSSRGLGRALVRAALDAGDLVAATARQPAQLDDLLAEYSERILTIGLDVTDSQAARSAIADARHHFGRLDVVVNNAGYANVSPIETTDDEDFHAPVRDQFLGRLPRLQSGDPGPSGATGRPHNADLLCRGLRRRLARDRLVPVRQVRDRRLQPGAAGRDRAVRREGHGRRAERPSDRLGRLLDDRPRHPRGLCPDGRRHEQPRPAEHRRTRRRPENAAEILVQVAKHRNIPYHLPLGVNAVEGSIHLDEQLLAEDRRWSEVSRSTDFSEPYPMALPADTPN